jgi:hypothetical protein
VFALPLALKVTVLPEQNVVTPAADIEPVGNGLTTTLTGVAVEVHPFASVTVTPYVPELVMFVMDAAVEPFVHAYIPTLQVRAHMV